MNPRRTDHQRAQKDAGQMFKDRRLIVMAGDTVQHRRHRCRTESTLPRGESPPDAVPGFVVGVLSAMIGSSEVGYGQARPGSVESPGRAASVRRVGGGLRRLDALLLGVSALRGNNAVAVIDDRFEAVADELRCIAVLGLDAVGQRQRQTDAANDIGIT